MGETLGVGYVGGLGRHCVQAHKPFLETSPLCRTVGIADIAGVNTDGFDLVDNPVLTEDYRDLLADERVGAVIIATRDDTHSKIAKDAIDANKHVMVEKPAATTVEELAQLPALFDLAEAKQRRLWVCHPREFGPESPWLAMAYMVGDPDFISKAFYVGPMGRLRKLAYDCHYTIPERKGVHTSFADDKLNHTIVSVLRALPDVVGFRNAVLLDNEQADDGTAHYEARLVTTAENKAQDGVIIQAAGRRSAHPEYHEGGVWRDWVEAIFDEGVLRLEPSLGRMSLMYGRQEAGPSIQFDQDTLYDDMFRSFNDEFVRCALSPARPEPLTRRARLLGTAAAILMQRPGFDGEVSERAVRQLGTRP